MVENPFMVNSTWASSGKIRSILCGRVPPIERGKIIDAQNWRNL